MTTASAGALSDHDPNAGFAEWQWAMIFQGKTPEASEKYYIMGSGSGGTTNDMSFFGFSMGSNGVMRSMDMIIPNLDVLFFTAAEHGIFDVFSAETYSLLYPSEEQYNDGDDPDPQGGGNSSVKKELPSYDEMNKNYPKDGSGGDMPAGDVYKLVGGDVYNSYVNDPVAYANACALRVSYALNKSGFKIPKIKGKTFKGGDGNYYFLGASSLNSWLTDNVRAPDLHPRKDFQNAINGNRGIFIMTPNYPGKFGASGHATLFNGSSCVGGVGHCYFGATGGVYQVNIWILK